MSLVVNQLGENALLTILKNAWGLYYRLYTNNYTPVPGDTINSFEEANFPGYAAVSGLTWGAAQQDGNGRAIITAGPAIFACNANTAVQKVYGYYVTDAGESVCYFAELFSDGPFSIAFNGDSVVVVPTFTLKSEF